MVFGFLKKLRVKKNRREGGGVVINLMEAEGPKAIYVDGSPIYVKKVIGTTQTHIVVETVDDKIISIPVDKISQSQKQEEKMSASSGVTVMPA